MTAILDNSMENIPSKVGVLKDNDQREYIRIVQNSTDKVEQKRAKDILVVKNSPLVYGLVQRFLGRGYEADDLCQVGIIGLLKAINNFNLSYDNCFSTYAVPMILGEIKRYIRDDQPIHISRSYKELGYKIYKAKEEFIQNQGREATIGELSKILAISTNEIIVALEANQRPNSLQIPINTSDNNKNTQNELQDIIPTKKDNEELWVDLLQLKESLKILPKRLGFIVNARYFREHTQEEIAKILGISQVQVSRLEKQALKILKSMWQEK